MAVIRKAVSAIQLSAAAIVKLPSGGRKKKLKQSIASTAVVEAGVLPQRVATNNTTSKNANATVVGLTCVPNALRTTVTAATLAAPTA
jgi:hypothetical protein